MATLTTTQPVRHPSPTARANRLAHLVFERPDLKEAEAFLLDFGLQTVSIDQDLLLMRGTGDAAYCYRVHRADKPRFVGFGLAVDDEQAFQTLANLPEASAVSTAEYPGGGQYVTLTDPNGFTIEVLNGQAQVAPLPHREPMTLNFGEQHPRVNAAQRPPVEPPQILRLGHVVLEVADYQATCEWYTRNFGFIPSDVQVLPDGSPAVTFMRLDLGDTPTDHHTLAIAQGFMPGYSHSAYELVDADAVGMGQRVLRERGYKHAWGLGRHILGSQIFDYWYDRHGDKHEHYCDGDLFTADVPTGVHPVSRDAMAQWGQAMPASFTRPRLNFTAIRALIHNLRRSQDLTLNKLITLARLFA